MGRYLFALAQHCHLTPRDVDELTLAEFDHFADQIDAARRDADRRGR